ncbi:BatD family protein [Mongoliibacter ruber]|uniref:Oxygen tolerance protein BatD n=1 Tax=Mongoliibacter ruber TaxID=1750599 RepID=A0A2T0WH33_9BACT|nr:BatD family protein [Mongoliibacter ruber]PRY85965.1 oxygen tolerance protein BatD [Mongoliibacter ruber]
MIRTLVTQFLVCLMGIISLTVQAQEVTIELGPDEIGLNETFSIKVTITNDKIKSYDEFPDITGFQKQGLSQSSSMNVINGQVTSTNSIIQYYKATRKGTFNVEPFSVKINGNDVAHPGKSVTVGDPRSSQRRSGAFDAFDDLFGRETRDEPEFIEIEDDAFFASSVDKSEVYVGEGFNVSLAFYMSETNQAPFQFYEPGRQLDEILKKMKPSNAWEENFNITNIQPERVTLNGKNYVKYKVYEATFFPFSDGEITIPSIAWEMIKYRVARNPTFFGSNRLEDFKTFYSSAKSVKVKPLPAHPLRNEVSVGVFQLRENVQAFDAQTGEGFTYNFGVSGEGNINSISAPRTKQIHKLNTFDPNVRQQINRGGGKVNGIKEFNYYLTINEPGEVNLSDHFEWIYFNPREAKYDTLRPSAVINVVGESKVNQAISRQRLGGLYDLIEVESNKLSYQRYKYYFSIFINLLLLASVVLLAVLIIRKNSNG